MTGEDLSSFQRERAKVIDAIRDGSAEVTADGQMTYRLKYTTGAKDALTFNRPNMRAYLEMDRYKEGQMFHKHCAWIAAITGSPFGFIQGLEGQDGKIVQAVANLFLGQ